MVFVTHVNLFVGGTFPFGHHFITYMKKLTCPFDFSEIGDYRQTVHYGWQGIDFFWKRPYK